jgi:hypothetical protein
MARGIPGCSSSVPQRRALCRRKAVVEPGARCQAGIQGRENSCLMEDKVQIENQPLAKNTFGPDEIWQSCAPGKPGKWWMICSEAQGEPELVSVEIHRGSLWAINCEIGSLPVNDYHEGLTNCMWQEAA